MDATDVMMQAFATSTEECTAEISTDDNNVLRVRQSYEVHIPKVNAKVLVDAAAINKISSLCETAKKARFPWAEVLLGASTLFLGAFLSALISQVPYEVSFESILSYNICPVLGIGFGVAFFFFRAQDVGNMKQFAE